MITVPTEKGKKKMKVIPELKKIAGLNDKINHLAQKVAQQIDADGLNLDGAYLVTGCSVKGKHPYQNGGRLDNCGLVDDLYFCNQHTGYCEDYFYGTLFFKTDVPGQFVAVPFEM